MLKTNYHTHSKFCDGKGEIEEIVECAIEKGFSILGFSSHTAYPFSDSWHMIKHDIPKYLEDIQKAKEKFSGRIKILKGVEADYLPMVTKPSLKENYASFNLDYIIGSVHYIETDKGGLTIDNTTERVKSGIEKIFCGNGKKCVQEYFYFQREMIKKGDFTILGHPDLVRKRNGDLSFFSENDSWYRKEIKETARLISKTDLIVEINTGAISRKAMDDVYPSKEFLSLLRERNVPITFSSDAHSKEDLDSNFDRAISAALSADYTECAYLDEGGKIKMQKIERE